MRSSLEMNFEHAGNIRNTIPLLSKEEILTILSGAAVNPEIGSEKANSFLMKNLLSIITGISIIILAVVISFIINPFSNSESHSDNLTTTIVGQKTMQSRINNGDKKSIGPVALDSSKHLKYDTLFKSKKVKKHTTEGSFGSRRSSSGYALPKIKNAKIKVKVYNGETWEIHSLERDSAVAFIDSLQKNNIRYSSNLHVFGSKRNDIDNLVLNPEEARNDSSIPGIIALELSKEELKKLNINLDETACTFRTEYITRIHPIPYRRKEEYRNSESVRKLVNNSYDTTGKEFIVKEIRRIDISDKSRLQKIDSLDNESRKLGPLTYNTNMTKEKKEEFRRKNKISNMIFLRTNKLLNDKQIMKSDNRPIDKYSRLTPVWYGYNFAGAERIFQKCIYNSPIFRFEFPEDEDNKSRRFDRFVPVRIKLINTPEDSLKYSVEKIILWYYPTEEFINALPERYSDRLRKELEIVNQVSNGIIPAEDACKGLEKEESFFDFCRISSGAIKDLKVYPNPVKNSATCSYKLSDIRNIDINLHDIEGRFITNISKTNNQKAGEHELSFNLERVPKGLYLLAVTSDKREQVVIRIIHN